MNPFLDPPPDPVVVELRKPAVMAQAEFLDLLVRLGTSTWVDAEHSEFAPTSFDVHFHDHRNIGG